eukprot:m.103180 g.103180  ORF g.103180 m.103180 type:complete len:366 (-) comp15711_c0_seq1:2-1099(-)
MTSESRPSGSSQTWWRSRWLKRVTLASSDGQYRGPRRSCWTWMLCFMFSRTISCVAGLVNVRWQSTRLSACATVVLRNEKGVGGLSEAWTSRFLKLTLSFAMRGGVPVFRRPSVNLRSSSVLARPIAGASPRLPAGNDFMPTKISPRRKVPVVMTTALVARTVPSPRATPAMRGWARSLSLSRQMSSTAAPMIDRLGTRLRAACMPERYSLRSICARGPQTAGPLLRFKMRNWMPASSHTRAQTPSSASISRTRWPLPTPPKDGLQDISPMVLIFCVTRAVFAPVLAAAAAASQPAWPPPTTTTSYVAVTAGAAAAEVSVPERGIVRMGRSGAAAAAPLTDAARSGSRRGWYMSWCGTVCLLLLR